MEVGGFTTSKKLTTVYKVASSINVLCICGCGTVKFKFIGLTNWQLEVANISGIQGDGVEIEQLIIFWSTSILFLITSKYSSAISIYQLSMHVSQKYTYGTITFIPLTSSKSFSSDIKGSYVKKLLSINSKFLRKHKQFWKLHEPLDNQAHIIRIFIRPKLNFY